MKTHLDLLHQLKDESTRKQTELEKDRGRVTTLSDEKQQIAVKMSPVHHRLKEIAKVEDDLAHMKGELSM